MTAADPAEQPQRVRGIDAAFLHNETRTTRWHIVGVLVLDPSTAPGEFDTTVLRRVISERIEQVEAFRRRVVDVRGALSTPHWVVDRTVDVTRHVRRASVPGFRGLEELARLAAQTAELALPRDRPLWQIEVLEDMGDGHVGLVAKVHHSVMDGIAAVGVLGALFDLEPTLPAGEQVLRAEPPRKHGLGVGHALRTVANFPVAVARAATHLPGAASGFVRALRDAGRHVTLPLSAPRTSLNRSITSARSVTLTTVPLADVRTVTRAFGLTVNDVVMTMVAGALRTWLEKAGDLPDKPMVAAVPVAIGGKSGHMTGNKISVLFASLPTHLSDPAARLAAMRDQMKDAKSTHRDVGQQTLGALAEAAPWNVVGLLFRAYSDLGLASRLPTAVNLIVSNVPGPPVAVYIGGARLVGLYPLGPIFDGAAMNVTIATCDEDVDIGIITCPDVAPGSVDELGHACHDALAELVALAEVSAPSELDE
jgi:diacylglycerol O-acyltransferase / wax synthase